MKKFFITIIMVTVVLSLFTAAYAYDNTNMDGGIPEIMAVTRLERYVGDRSGLIEHPNATVPVKFYPDLAGKYFYARSSVQSLANTGIFEGHTDKKFHPMWHMTEHEMGLVVSRFGKYITNADISAKYDEMMGDSKVERQELVAALYDVLKCAGVEMSSDVSFGNMRGSEKIDADKLEAYKAFFAAGIIGGDIRDNLRADSYINRADAAVIVCNVLRYLDMLPN